MSGLRYRSSIAFLSAPSAKSLIFKSDIAMIVLFGITHNPIYRVWKRADTGVGRERGSPLAIFPVEKNGAAAGGPSGVDVSPAIAEQERAVEVDAVPLLCLDQQSRRRFAAKAAIPVVVRADQKVVEREGL